MARLRLSKRSRGSRDYDLVCGGREVGDAMLFEGTNDAGDQRWFWSLSSNVGLSPEGDERSFSSALRRLGAAASRVRCGR